MNMFLLNNSILVLHNSNLFPLCLQSLVEEQQSQLNQYECAAGQCVNELQKAQLQVQSLQAKIQESEANNMVTPISPVLMWFSIFAFESDVPLASRLQKLQEKLSEMERELRSIRQAAQNQERTIQGLTESNSTKDREVRALAAHSLLTNTMR